MAIITQTSVPRILGVGGLLVVLGLSVVLVAGEVRQRAAASYDEIREQIVQNANPTGTGRAVAGQQEVLYLLANGWNLISLPVQADGLKTALDLIVSVAEAGGYVTTISSWDGDRWVELTVRGNQQYGHNFPLENGKAYFVRNHERVVWSVVGKPLKADQLLLQRGWNGVGGGVVSSIKYQVSGMQQPSAEGVLDGINSGKERVTEIDRWESGVWDPFVKRLYSEKEIETYGTNFVIEANRGYMVRALEDMEVSSIK